MIFCAGAQVCAGALGFSFPKSIWFWALYSPSGPKYLYLATKSSYLHVYLVPTRLLIFRKISHLHVYSVPRSNLPGDCQAIGCVHERSFFYIHSSKCTKLIMTYCIYFQSTKVIRYSLVRNWHCDQIIQNGKGPCRWMGFKRLGLKSIASCLALPHSNFEW